MYETMLDYGDVDVASMREICMGLSAEPDDMRTLREDYRVSEAVNDRGIHASRRWIEHAAQLKPVVEESINAELVELTDGGIKTVKSGTAARDWFLKQLIHYLPKDERLTETDDSGVITITGHKVLSRVKKHRKSDGTGWWSDTRPSLDRSVRAALRALLEPDGDADVLPRSPPPSEIERMVKVLDLLDEGSGAAASKYEAGLRMLEGIDDDRLRGLYILDGASQTGRFSSVQLQSHNFIRKPPPEDPGTVSDWMRKQPRRGLREAVQRRYDMPVHELLGRMLRPTLIAPEGRALVWGDWSAIEARVCPWLSSQASAEPLLDLFRSGEDVYLHTASQIVGRAVEPDETETRQLGKVATLALGFGGAIGAYAAMARGYGVPPMERTKVQLIVSNWREANLWARKWWDELQWASMRAVRTPGDDVHRRPRRLPVPAGAARRHPGHVPARRPAAVLPDGADRPGRTLRGPVRGRDHLHPPPLRAIVIVARTAGRKRHPGNRGVAIAQHAQGTGDGASPHIHDCRPHPRRGAARGICGRRRRRDGAS